MDREFDRYTVRGLRNLARDRGLRRYSRLRRDELITLLINTGPSILDRDIGTTGDPVLIPIIAPPLPSTSRQRPITLPSSVDNLLRSLENDKDVPKSISPEVKALKDKIAGIYKKLEQIKIEEPTRSALNKWAEEHKIPGIPVSSHDEFLEMIQPSILNISRKKRGTKVKINLQCYMKRGDGVDGVMG